MRLRNSIVLCAISMIVSSTNSVAAISNGKVVVEDRGSSEIFDPEHPENNVNPGDTLSTKGSLRIDFVSPLNFGRAYSGDKDKKYNSLAQLFLDETPARGYFIQVSDFRQTDGWELQLTQKSQFRSAIIQDLENQELKGATLSFDKGWASSNGNGTTPLVTRDAVVLSNLNTAYSIATANQGEGKGSWSIAFGSSEDNPQKNKPTLSPLSESNKPVMNEKYKKQEYSNSAISLTVPDTAKIYPVEYTTKLEWTLVSGPN
ncbi:WxL domain-containing protein [Vagococcus sp. JNUCC 83]